MQGLLQLQLPMIGGDQFHRRSRQIGRGGENVAVIGFHHRFFHRNVVDGHIVHGVLNFPFVQAHARGGVGLGVKVAQQHLQSQIMERRCQIHRRGGLAHAAFLIDHCKYFSHFSLLTIPDCFT